MDMKRRILSCFLAFCMIFALLPAPAQAAGNAENAAATVKATVQHAETGQITAQIEAYMTDPANKTRTVKPCDIIFLIEQSKFMNTQNGSANSGDERAEILGAIERLLDGMPQPTTGGEHRIAIAGYGRINNPGIGDSYDAALYPGRLSSDNASLNTAIIPKTAFIRRNTGRNATVKMKRPCRSCRRAICQIQIQMVKMAMTMCSCRSTTPSRSSTPSKWCRGTPVRRAWTPV